MVDGPLHPDALVRARGLTKAFGDFVAVDGVDFEVRRGEVFGFLGPNGAGKTSTMRMISCVSPSTGGELSVLHLDPRTDGPAIRSRIGVVPQEDNLDTELSVWDNFIVYGRYFGLPRRVLRERAQELLEFARLTDRRDDRVDPLSGGMKRRLTIARALINDPDLVLLDEPTTGLDPQARHLLWDRLYGLKRRGVTLIITTHYMDEAEQLCDRLVVMDQGRIVDEGSPRELIHRHVTPEVIELRFAEPAEQEAALSSAGEAAERIEVLADRLLLYTRDAEATHRALAERSIEPLTELTRRASLEDVFLALTGRTLEE
ncbi:ABC transporter ATP-binding protein [Acidimicrobiia bacterium EGI L10123]|uniref:ABC transporter ATP-binding protein n=1 Tax=Salinilacustrithrix flava TaxID=2957203 RepID=UPI003D7C1920|nr:ABC transporter ATP-binding protein [Acidimicrobiia bacterium EGI L10123]